MRRCVDCVSLTSFFRGPRFRIVSVSVAGVGKGKLSLIQALIDSLHLMDAQKFAIIYWNLFMLYKTSLFASQKKIFFNI